MEKPFALLLAGHVLFVASGLAYTAHWRLHFLAPGPLDTAFLAASLAAGVAGVVLLCLFLASGSATAGLDVRSLWPVPAVCLAMFLAVLLLTSLGWQRPFTSELPLLLVWACLEGCALLAAWDLEYVGRMGLGISALLSGLAAVAGILCYAVYYLLGGNTQHVVGLVPYFAVSVSMAATTVFLFVRV